MTVVYADLEEKSTPANTGLMPTPIGQTPGPTQQHAQPAPLGAQLPNQVATAQRGAFQMGVAGTCMTSYMTASFDLFLQREPVDSEH